MKHLAGGAHCLFVFEQSSDGLQAALYEIVDDNIVCQESDG
ncbi:hypothetical protein [Xylella taiwanensis]|nr:hypothetical protein [Xylella taiwanensis]